MTLLPYSSLKRSTTPIRKRRKVREHEKGQAVTVFPDGREVCNNNAAGRAEYKKRTEDMWIRQSRICADCGHIAYYPTFDHEGGRGLGGSRRDDRIEIDGKPHNAMLCGTCNGIRGSQRYPYKFLPY